MFEWSEEHRMVRDAVRTFVDTEIRPRRDEIEFGDTPPYELLPRVLPDLRVGRDGARPVQEAYRRTT